MITDSFLSSIWYLMGTVHFYSWWVVFKIYCTWIVEGGVNSQIKRDICMGAIQEDILRNWNGSML